MGRIGGTDEKERERREMGMCVENFMNEAKPLQHFFDGPFPQLIR